MSFSRLLIFLVHLILLVNEQHNVTAFEEYCYKVPDVTNQLCNENGDLKVRFCPRIQNNGVTEKKFKSITCSSNKPTNITITLKGKAWPGGASILTTSCNKTIQFDGGSICYKGTYICTVKDASGKTIVREAHVNVFDERFNFDFEVENKILKDSKQLIVGSTINLTCSIAGNDWQESNHSPDFKFGYKEVPGGKFIHIEESKDIPKKYFYRHEHKENGVFTRNFQISRITQNDSRAYICSVRSFVGYCDLEKVLNVTTRLCKPGHYCDADSSVEQPCPAGYYSNISGVFGISSCMPCARGTYCTVGSKSQTICPLASYLPINKADVIPLKPASSVSDCRRCPLNESCDNSYNCKFICASAEAFANEGKSAELKCKLIIQRYLLQNLRWRKGSQYLERNDDYDIYEKGDYFYLVIKKTITSHAGVYTCEGYDTWKNKTVYDGVKLRVVGEDDVLTIVLAVVGTITFLIIAGLCALYFLKRKGPPRFQHHSTSSQKKCLETICTVDVTEQYWPEPVRNVQSPPAKAGVHEFDVFICYSSHDKIWVRKTLLKTLLANKLRVCIDYKDFAPGAYIIKNIADAIDRSRKTIAVLSPEFVASYWCNEELQMALVHIEDEHQVIPVMYRTCEMPSFIRQRTYLDWSNPDIQPTFWDQLIRAINGGNSGYNKDETDEDVFEPDVKLMQIKSTAQAEV